MKLSILINAVLLLIAGSITGAGISGNEGLVSQLQKEVSYPGFLKENNKEVEVRISFKVKEDGKVELIDINTGDKRMKEYVITRLTSLRFGEGTFTPGVVYSMKLSFKIV